MKAFVEGYGCSLNRADTCQIKCFLAGQGFELAEGPEDAALIVLNTCAVKEQTESRMLKRIRLLNSLAEKHGSVFVVFGCLPKINSKAVSSVSKKIIQIGPSLEGLASFLQLPKQGFSPKLDSAKSSEAISIIPIARGCLGECSYCCVKNARGSLKSYSIRALNHRFRKEITRSKEIWLTAQDCGCYGFDMDTNLVELLKALLENDGDFRVRLGMINPGHLEEFLPSYLALFEDTRLFRFFHVPVQSGSNAILKAMNRPYKAGDFLRIVKKIRERLPDASVSTDVIVGFPGETEQGFRETVSLLRKAKPDVVNISRFGARPNTAASLMKDQLHGRVKKDRSRILTKLCKEIALKRNNAFVSSEHLILVDEPGSKGNFVGRNQGYKPVVVKEGLLNSFLNVRVTRASQACLYGEPLK